MKDFIKDEKGLGPITTILSVVIIAIMVAALIGWSITNGKAEAKKINPNINYAGNGIIKISGNNSTELVSSLKEFNWMNSCRMDTDQPLSITIEQNKTYVLLAINDACARNFN